MELILRVEVDAATCVGTPEDGLGLDVGPRRALLHLILFLAQSEDSLLQLILLDLHEEVRLFQVVRQLLKLLVAQRLVFFAQREETAGGKVVLTHRCLQI